MLHITTTSHLYSCQPKTKDELQEIIIQRIIEDGLECDLNDIDVSKIKDMSYLFNARENIIFKEFNGDISRWDVSKVTNMSCMFHQCKKFNCDISDWNVSNVKDMDGMFIWCKSFEQNLDNWDVSNVKHIYNAFLNCPTQPEWYNHILKRQLSNMPQYRLIANSLYGNYGQNFNLDSYYI